MKRFALIATILASVGCTHRPPPTTRPSLATTQPSYWLDEPAVATVKATDFDKLWAAAERVARDRGFVIDREDYRRGLMTSQPLTSKQWFEVWRSDVQTPEDLADSSLATYRRTLSIEVEKKSDGTFEASPYVLIERYVQSERPITSSVYLSRAFSGRQTHRRQGSPESDRGVRLPSRYWYPTGRDTIVERDIAKAMQHRVSH